MKAKYKKFLIVCGKVFMLVCLAAFALLCVFYYATPKDKAQAIQVNAEETVASATDLSKYPTVNLISYPYVDKRTTINGVTFTVNNDGTVNVNGTATARCDFSLSNYVPVTVGASYFFSGCPIGGGSDTFISRISMRSIRAIIGGTDINTRRRSGSFYKLGISSTAITRLRKRECWK